MKQEEMKQDLLEKLYEETIKALNGDNQAKEKAKILIETLEEFKSIK